MKKPANKILFYDADCSLCNHSVRLVQRINRRKTIFFAPLKGETAIEHAFIQSADVPDSVIYFKEGRYFTHSEAIIEVLSDANVFFYSAKLAYILPKKWRKLLYSWLADNRNRIFVKNQVCPLPKGNQFLR